MAAGDDKASRAMEMMAKAEAAKNKWTLWPSNSKYEEAAQYYENASNLFRTAKQNNMAGKALMNAAEMNLKCSNTFEAANNFVKAANCFRKDSPAEAVHCLRIAIAHYTDSGKFAQAARHSQEVGEILESQLELEEAINAYETAAEYLEGNNNASQAAKCLLKVASFSAQLEKYDRAIEIFEQVGQLYLGINLLKWSANELFLKAGLCHLANGDLVGAKRAIQTYKEINVTFSSKRECKFLEELVKAFEKPDVNEFSKSCGQYDSMTPFDAWMTTILLRIKNKMPGLPGSGLAPPSVAGMASAPPSASSAPIAAPPLPDDLS